MKIGLLLVLAGLATVAVVAAMAMNGEMTGQGSPKKKMPVISLPKAKTKGQMSVEEALQKRRSRREFADEALTLEQLGQLLWAAQGQTHPWGYRTAPSAGALYPMELYAVVGKVEGLQAGLYHYEVAEHGLKRLKSGDLRRALQRACLGQGMIGAGPVSIIMAADYGRTAKKYKARAKRYVHIEAGHIGQNIYLQAESLGLGTCAVGAFSDSQVKGLLGIAEEPVYVMPLGVPANNETKNH